MPEDSKGTGSRANGNTGEEKQGKKHLLVFAVGDYPENGRYKKLPHVIPEAKSFVTLLTSKDFEYGFDHVTTLYDKDCKRDAIKTSLAITQQKLEPEDQVLVFFSGHGTVANKNGYWVCHDAQDIDILNLSVVDAINELLSLFKCKQVLLIVDCCFSGQAAKEAYKMITYKGLSDQQGTFTVITSCRHDQESPGKSAFMAALMRILKTTNIANYYALMQHFTSSSELVEKNIEPFSQNFDGNAKNSFILRRKDEFSYYLAESFFELNFKAQDLAVEPPRIFDLAYLRGTPHCGHQLFTERYFRKFKKMDLSMFNYPAQIISYGNEGQGATYDLWERLAEKINFFSKEPKEIIDQLVALSKHENLLFVIKIDSCVAADMKSCIVKFWDEAIAYLSTIEKNLKDCTCGVYFFVWDRRGLGGDIENLIKESDVKKQEIECAKLTVLDPTDLLKEKDDIEVWFRSIKNMPELKKAPEFTKEIVQGIEKPHTMQNVILQIATKCNRSMVYYKLFNKNQYNSAI